MFQRDQNSGSVALAVAANVIRISAAILIGIVATACAPLDDIGLFSKDRLIVSSRPGGATVFVDGKERGKTPVKLKLEAGEHLISLSLEHYAPWEDVVSIRQGETQRIEPALTFRPYSVRLSETLGKAPAWSSDGSKVYFIRSTTEGDRIMQVEIERPSVESELFSLNGNVLIKGGWSPDGRQLLVISSTGGSEGLFVFDFSSGKQSQVYQDGEQERFLAIANFGIVATWGAEGEVYFVLYRKGPDWGRDNPYALVQEIWRSGRDRTELERLYEFPSPALNGLDWVVGGGLLLEKHDSLFRMSASDVEPISLVNSGIIKASEWSPDGSRITYLWVERESDLENTLSVMDAAGNHTEALVKGNLTHFHWMAGSKWLVYFTYSVLEKGSSCWAVDVETGERTLLADPAILKQLVFDFAVSPDGTRIAFEGEDGHIWLLVLDETKESQGVISGLTEWWNQ